MKKTGFKYSALWLKNFGLRGSLYVLLFFVFSQQSFAQVSATLDTTSLRIGEEFIYKIEAKADTSAFIQFPEGQTFLPLEVIEKYPIDTSFVDSKIKLIKKYGLTQFDAGTYTIPQQRVLINDLVLYTDTLLVEVADVVVDTLIQPMFDIKPFMEVPSVKRNWLTPTLWVLLALIILALIAYLLLRQKKKRDQAQQKLPPFEEALVALQTLDNSPLLQENKVKDYYSSLTEIVKRYLDREVDEMALESTTDELISVLNQKKQSGKLEFSNTTIEKLQEILKRADLIKFAKMKMEGSQAQLDRRDIEEIIKVTHESIPEPTEEEKLQDALYKEAQLKKKRRKNIGIAIASLFGVLLLTVLILVAVFGWNNLKEKIVPHPTKKLLSTEWVRSEYGNPVITLETPKVLVRQSQEANQPALQSIQSDDVFAFGSLTNNFYILVGSSQYEQNTAPDFELLLDQMFLNLENQGAYNIIVNKNPFETQDGVEGIKVEGSFDFQSPEKRRARGRFDYTMLLFVQTDAIQTVVIAHNNEDTYAQQVVERVINSLQIELRNKR